MKCRICKQTEDETELFEGIYDGKVVNICERCADVEGIPLIKKPTEEQLIIADRRYSVRERMEKMAGIEKKRPLSREQIITNENLAKLKIPRKKQEHPKLVENYYWRVQMVRRKKKLSINHVAEGTGIEREILEDIENGRLPDNVEEVMRKLERFLGVKLVKEFYEEKKHNKS